jgi:hypothetical protein
MKKAASKKSPVVRRVAEDDIRPEYDFSNARPNPYAARFNAGVTVVALDADVAESFPDAASVNEALRALAKIAKRPASKSRSKRRTA